MRVPDDVKKCAVFFILPKAIASGAVEEVDTASGFIAEVKNETANLKHHYLVTARHVAEQCSHGAVKVRLNTIAGTSQIVELNGENWKFHPTDETVDVAVMPWPIPQSEFDWRAIPVEPMFLAGRRTLAGKDIGIGDNTYSIGLFRTIAGRSRAMPLLRAGTIAMIPEERVATDWKTAAERGIEAYLIDSTSIRGLSGAPVLVARTIDVVPAEHTGRIPVAEGAHFLLGLIHGHSDVALEPAERLSDFRRDQINFGLALVVPAQKIFETLNSPCLVAERRQASAATA